MPENIFRYICAQLSVKFVSADSISGGDISQAFLLSTDQGRFFVKINDSRQALDMFRKEGEALKAMVSAGVKAPHVCLSGAFEDSAFLVMEYIAPGPKSRTSMEELGQSLARLHQHHGEQFGWNEDNYIGSLVQTNQWHDTWATFYITERLWPQLSMAKARGYHVGSMDKDQMISKMLTYQDEVFPSLLHGDLWAGNYISGSYGQAYLIDPAVYFGDREVDLAMTKLFGGFSNDFYSAYDEVLPLKQGFNERIELYQLYYLLVHLNLFGSSYLPQVSSIMRRYF
ncbi:MAG: fructosamine kinase family protein [Saprospiraceae bacterium]|nr:fructosamine kinase family protein [Saprospiraceae bacterium]